MGSHRRVIIVSVIALLGALALLIAFANLGQLRANYWEGRAESCGALHYAAGRLMTATAEAQAAEACFAHALPGCHSATLSATVMGVDTGATDTFLIQPPLGSLGSCQIVLTASYSGIGPALNHTETMTCQSLALTSDSLTISGCGTQGDVTLPATQGARWPNIG